jgi:hypothetical protein
MPDPHLSTRAFEEELKGIRVMPIGEAYGVGGLGLGEDPAPKRPKRTRKPRRKPE